MANTILDIEPKFLKTDSKHYSPQMPKVTESHRLDRSIQALELFQIIGYISGGTQDISHFTKNQLSKDEQATLKYLRLLYRQINNYLNQDAKVPPKLLSNFTNNINKLRKLGINITDESIKRLGITIPSLNS